MANTINRRNWIRSGAVMAGSMAFLSGAISKLAAMPVVRKITRSSAQLTDKAAVLQSPPGLKARLLANENPFGPSAAAKKAIADALDTSFQYPFFAYDILSGKIAEYEGLKRTNLLIDAGSSAILHAAAQYYAKGGKSIITADPSYDDLPSHAEKFDAKWVKIPLTKDYITDLDAMEKAIDDNTGLVYICNPNNPTGTIVDSEKLKSFCERVSKKVPVFVDEAYIDYLPNEKAASMMSLVKSGSNIIVARTFSKLYGFAGLRCGYIAAQPDVVKALGLYTGGAFNVSATTMAAAIAGYRETAYLDDARKKMELSKQFLYDTLKKEGYTYIPSSANFVMFPLKMDGMKFVSELMKRSVGVRNWKINGQDWCRISIGRMDEMETFAAAFKEIS